MPTPRNLENRRVVLAARPVGIPQAAHFALEAVSVPEPADGQVLVRNRYLSVDPAMRGWVNAAANYAPPVPVGEVMRSFAAGEVIASASRLFKAGDLVTGMFGWQQYAVVDAQAARAIPHDDLPLSTALGVLGLNGVTAYWEPWLSGPRIERHLLVKRARAEGFLLFDWMDRYDEAVQALAAWVRDGQLRYQEHVLKGLASAPDAIAMLYRGENQGKLLIEIE